MIDDESLTLFFLQAYNIIFNTDAATVYETVKGEDVKTDLFFKINHFTARGDNSKLCELKELLNAPKKRALENVRKFNQVSLYAFVFDF